MVILRSTIKAKLLNMFPYIFNHYKVTYFNLFHMTDKADLYKSRLPKAGFKWKHCVV